MSSLRVHCLLNLLLHFICNATTGADDGPDTVSLAQQVGKSACVPFERNCAGDYLQVIKALAFVECRYRSLTEPVHGGSSAESVCGVLHLPSRTLLPTGCLLLWLNHLRSRVSGYLHRYL